MGSVAKMQQNIHFDHIGVISKVMVKPGDEVKKRQVLAELTLSDELQSVRFIDSPVNGVIIRVKGRAGDTFSPSQVFAVLQLDR